MSEEMKEGAVRYGRTWSERGRQDSAGTEGGSSQVRESMEREKEEGQRGREMKER